MLVANIQSEFNSCIIEYENILNEFVGAMKDHCVFQQENDQENLKLSNAKLLNLSDKIRKFDKKFSELQIKLVALNKLLKITCVN